MMEFEGQKRTGFQKGNGTLSAFKVFKDCLFFKVGNIFRSFYSGGGSGGDEDGGPTFFGPRRWNFLPFIVSDSLLHYDLQW